MVVSVFGPWMRLHVDVHQLRVVVVGVALRGRDAGMAEEFLNGAQIRAADKNMRGEAVAQRVGRDGFRQADGFAQIAQVALRDALR